jgi:uncharacterized protein
MQDKGKPNALINETSPYLLQHAHNPVQWMPWSTNAFALAKKQDKPVFVSIGYSTCHWCHVMERESFENKTIADFLNKHFISIKVDREERPDIDAMLMDVCQAMTGSGGWPLTVMMDSEMRPFFAGTYFAPVSGNGRIGFLELLQRIISTWNTERARLIDSAKEAQNFLVRKSNTDYSGVIDAKVLGDALEYHVKHFDEEYGGFSDRPKFPSPHHLLFLMRVGRLRNNTECFRMVSQTLDAMLAGGIYDHVGYGFHRYSTDHKWLVPHFEKMLYDQAMLMWTITEAWQATGIDRYKVGILEVAEYVRNFLTSKEGAFYSAQDADSDGIEGKYYVWSTQELKQILGDEYHNVEVKFNVKNAGNFSDEATGEATGQNILHVTLGRWLAESPRIPPNARKKLLDVRAKRVPPITDTKVLMDWNGLMIGALAQAARALDDGQLTKQAERAYKACQNLLSTTAKDGHIEWFHSFRIGRHGVPAMIDDVSMMAFAALELYQTTGDNEYLEDSVLLMDMMLKHFSNKGGSYSITRESVSDIPVRYRSMTDGAYPSGLSIAVEVATALFAITKDAKWDRLADSFIQSVAKMIAASPVSFCMMLSTYQCRESGVFGIEVPKGSEAGFVKKGTRLLRSAYLPEMYFVYKDSDADYLQVCTDTYCLERMDSQDKIDSFLQGQMQK